MHTETNEEMAALAAEQKAQQERERREFLFRVSQTEPVAEFYQVGGCVRDELLGLKSKDIDYSVEAPSYEAMFHAVALRCGVVDIQNIEDVKKSIKVEKPEFVTLRGIDPKLGGVDFVLCRKDGAYSDGRRPDSIEMGTLMDDLARRDFTVNAIAKDDAGNVIDPFAGQYDLDRKMLRCVGSVERLREDSLRMLRALRFSLTKGFGLASDLEMFLLEEANAKLLDNVSIERVREELLKCFQFDTLATLRMLERFPAIRNHIFSRNIKLVPTVFPLKG